MIDAQRWARWVVYFTDWAGFLTSAPAGAALPGVRPDDIAQIQYTSGTTGGPAPSPDELRAYCRSIWPRTRHPGTGCSWTPSR